MTGASTLAPGGNLAALTGISTNSYSVPVEVCLKAESAIKDEDVALLFFRIAQANSNWYRKVGVLSLNDLEEDLRSHVTQHVEEIKICPTGDLPGKLFFWQVQPEIQSYRLHSDGPAEDDDVEDGVPGFVEWELPSRSFHGVWETLVYDTGIKERLVSHAQTSLAFSAAGVDQNIIAWNKVVLLHGPPGTGKTSLCKALAQKLSVNLRKRFPRGHLIEVNAHSLFSKWFSESGKLVTKLFSKIGEFVDDSGAAVFVLIDEVESLTAARRAAVAGSEPSDAIRAVNALLTHLDALRSRPNVMVLCTSNLPEAVDIAFVDRADIKAYIGPPSAPARYAILRSCILELHRAGVLAPDSAMPPSWAAAEATAASQYMHGAQQCTSQEASGHPMCAPPGAAATTVSGTQCVPASGADDTIKMHTGPTQQGNDTAGDSAMSQDGAPRPHAPVPVAWPGTSAGTCNGQNQAAVGESILPTAVQNELSAVKDVAGVLEMGSSLRRLVLECDGLSGRALRKLPFLAVASLGVSLPCARTALMHALEAAVVQEISDRACLRGD
eukprot:jgi/Ulvmu1/7447/UM036_0109.1